MDDKSPDRGKAPPSLASALRSARAEAAERSQSLSDLRGAELARLELLRDALDPVLAQVPDDIDLFDTGIVPGERPRLFIDMIAFIDMARDRRTYRFHLDTRHGRVLLAESDSLAPLTGAVTTYIARRLVEREKALASLGDDATIRPLPVARSPSTAQPRAAPTSAPPKLKSIPRRGLRLAIDGLAILALAGLVWLGVSYAQGRLWGW